MSNIYKDWHVIAVYGYLREYSTKWAIHLPSELIDMIIMFYRLSIPSQILNDDQVYMLDNLITTSIQKQSCLKEIHWDLVWRYSQSKNSKNIMQGLKKSINGLNNIIIIMHTYDDKEDNDSHNSIWGWYSFQGVNKHDCESFMYFLQSNDTSLKPKVFPPQSRSYWDRTGHKACIDNDSVVLGTHDARIKLVPEMRVYMRHDQGCYLMDKKYVASKNNHSSAFWSTVLSIKDVEIFQLTYGDTKPIIDTIVKYKNELKQLWRNKADINEYKSASELYGTSVNRFEVKIHRLYSYRLVNHRNELLNVLRSFNDGIIDIIQNGDKIDDEINEYCNYLQNFVLRAHGIETINAENEYKYKIVNPVWFAKYYVNKLKNRINGIKRDLYHWQRKAIAPILNTYFIQFNNLNDQKLFSKFDRNGVPTHDAKKNKLSKKYLKKLMKQFEKQQNDHQRYLEKIKDNPHFIENMVKDLEKAKARYQDEEIKKLIRIHE